MFDKEAIQAIQEGASIEQASEAVQLALKGDCAVALPNNFVTHDLEAYLPNRRRARGLMATATLEAFADYTKQHAEEGSTVFVDSENLSATAVLNLGNPTKAGQCDNLAKLTPKKTAAYYALLDHTRGNALSQTAVAEFFEDWVGFAKFFNDDGEIMSPKAIAALRKISIEAMRKMENAEGQLSATRSAFEDVQAKSTEPLPTTIYFKCVPYADLVEREFVLRLSVLTSGDKPHIILRIVKKEEHDEEMAIELANKVKSSFFTYDGAQNIPVLLGTYTKTK